MAQLLDYGSSRPVNEGERLVVAALAERLPEPYLILPNVEIAESNGRRFEYDVIVIAPHGIYVIEVKQWRGDIYR